MCDEPGTVTFPIFEVDDRTGAWECAKGDRGERILVCGHEGCDGGRGLCMDM